MEERRLDLCRYRLDKAKDDLDYDDFYIAAYNDAKMQFENASKFIKRIELQIEIFLKEIGNKGKGENTITRTG